jgi:TolB protein
MNRRTALLTCLAPALHGQSADIISRITGGQQPTIAIPDFRGAGEAQPWMQLFNLTLFDEVSSAGLFRMAPKSFYPLQVPQAPQDWKAPVGGRSQGPWLTDWSNPTVKANYLAMGYTAIQNNQLVLFGWLYDVTQPDLTNAQMFGKVYFGPITEDGAKKIAREFAADILAKFGAKSLLGSKIYFVSNRTGSKEIWSMDYDGSNQRPLTRFNSICTTPALSPDNSKIAFTSFLQGNPGITVLNAESARRLTFVNPVSSIVASPDFTPDGKSIFFSTKIGGGFPNIFSSNSDGSNLSRVTSARAVETEPKINPKNSSEVVFVSGRSGPVQIYRMNSSGSDVERLTDGTGTAANPSWHPNGQIISFSWTRGLEPGDFNIFMMDVAKREITQLTHGAGRNLNPVWGPDGLHLVFCSNRSGSLQIWTMLADGTRLRQLTTAGRNEMPIWTH